MIREIEMSSKDLKDRILNNPEFENICIQLMRNDVCTMSLTMGSFINNGMLYELSYDSMFKKHYFYINNSDNKYIGCMILFDSVIIFLRCGIVLKIRVVNRDE